MILMRSLANKFSLLPAAPAPAGLGHHGNELWGEARATCSPSTLPICISGMLSRPFIFFSKCSCKVLSPTRLPSSIYSLPVPMMPWQALQIKQKFEREDHLVELEERRKLLIKRLREYNGTEWEIVQEAHAFVGEPVQREDDLVVPLYQSSVRDVHALGEGGSVSGLSRRRQSSSSRSSLASRSGDEEDEPKQAQEVSQAFEPTNNKTTSSTHFSGFVFGLTRLATRAGEVLRLSSKSALVVASIMFTLSQLEPQLRKWSADKALNPESHEYGRRRRSNRPSSFSNSSGIIVQDESCPPGKVLLVQKGVQKCFVKERVEAPFKVIKQPDASYGYD